MSSEEMIALGITMFVDGHEFFFVELFVDKIE